MQHEPIMLGSKAYSMEELLHPKNRGMSAVYVLNADEHAVKIGVSTDPGKRAIAIQTGQDRDIRVYWAIQLWKPQARAVERELHTRLRRTVSHIRGEWYLLSPAQAVSEIKQEIARLGYESQPDTIYGWGDRA